MEQIVTRQEILQLVPNRYPFLLLDRVVELEPGVSGKGIKNVTIDEAYFTGHFPDEKVMPGILIVEACAQLTAVVCRSPGLLEAKRSGAAAARDWKPSSSVEYIASIERFKFLKPIIPGDQLLLEAEVGKRFQNLLRTVVRARVDGSVVAEGTLIATSRSRR